mmetsp:Transcript_7646/g.34021  ORF Transcript_7646/g.34021 Transcript_7646/m.34021 type:complete len:514 (-) Transcript_7646:135-1676(-)
MCSMVGRRWQRVILGARVGLSSTVTESEASYLRSCRTLRGRRLSSLSRGWLSDLRTSSRIANSGFLRRSIASLPHHNELGLPKLSPTMETGNIVKWLKAEGDAVSAGDSLAEIETDKATLDFDTTDDGFLAKILLPDGTNDIPIGTPICVIVENQGDIAAFADYSPSAPNGGAESDMIPSDPFLPDVPATPDTVPVEPIAASPTPVSMEATVSAPAVAPRSGVFASFRARKHAAETGIELSKVVGTGMYGSVTMKDLEAYMASSDFAVQADTRPSAVPMPTVVDRPDEGYYEVAVGPIRKAAAERAVASKQTVPHFYLNVECNVDKLLQMIEDWNEKEKTNLKLRDVMIKAAAVAVQKEPALGGTLMGSAVRRLKHVDLCVEVFTNQGPVFGVLRNADRKGIEAIAEEVSDLDAKGKAGLLTPEESSGGTLAISDLSDFGVKNSTPLVFNNQAGTIAIGAVQQSAKIDGDDLKVQNTLFLTLSCDHRHVDGAVGAQWMKHMKKFVENPVSMLL